MSPSIHDLQFQTEPLTPVDQAAAEEASSFVPGFKPGRHEFVFALEEESDTAPWSEKTRDDGTRVYTLTYKLLDPTPESRKKIRFCRASSYKSANMKNSRLDELIFALGLSGEYNARPTISNADTLLRQAEAQQKHVFGNVIWRAYDEDSGLTMSTSPQKGYTKRDGTAVPAELPASREGDGSISRLATFPSGKRLEWRAEVTRVSPVK